MFKVQTIYHTSSEAQRICEFHRFCVIIFSSGTSIISLEAWDDIYAKYPYSQQYMLHNYHNHRLYAFF